MKKKTKPAPVVNIRDAAPALDLVHSLIPLNYDDERLAAGLLLHSTGKSPITKTSASDGFKSMAHFEGEIYAHTPDGKVYEVRRLAWEKDLVSDGFGLLQSPKGHFYPVSFRNEVTGHFISAIMYDAIGRVTSVNRTVQEHIADLAHRRLMEWDRTTTSQLPKAHPRHYRGDWHDNSPRAVHLRKSA